MTYDEASVIVRRAARGDVPEGVGVVEWAAQVLTAGDVLRASALEQEIADVSASIEQLRARRSALRAELLADATFRRCIGFAKRERMDYVDLVNLSARIATHPRDLLPGDVGPFNEHHIYDAFVEARDADAAQQGARACAAWGNNVHASESRVQLVQMIARVVGVPLYCLGTNRDGSPCHPLRLPKTRPFVPWRAA